MTLIPNINNQALQLLPDIALWKKQISDAINYKGGTSSPDEAFTILAEDIKSIPNFDNWVRLASVMCCDYAKSQIEGLNLNNTANVTVIEDPLGIITNLRDHIFQFWINLEVINLPHTKITYTPSHINQRFYGCSNLQKVILSNSDVIGIQDFYDCGNLTLIHFGTLAYNNNNNNILYSGNKNKLRNFIVGDGSDCNLNLTLWTATNVIAEGESGINELNSNLYNNLLTKLYDHSNDGETRTLRLGWLAHVTPENIAYANAKGWTLTT